jgi:hypothetical protein
MQSGDRVRMTREGLKLELLPVPCLDGVVSQIATDIGMVQVQFEGEERPHWWPMFAWKRTAEPSRSERGTY